MSICAKCNTSIKPASLATTSGDDNFHPTCISCCKCDRPLWGRGFKRNKQRKLECDPDCETNGPIAVYRAKKPTSASKQNGGGPPVGSGPKGFRPVYDEEQTARPTPRVEPQSSYPSPPPPQPSATSYPPSPTYPPRSPFYPATQQQQPPPSIYDLNQYRKPGADLNGIKMCKTCGQNLQNKRYLTYESGETICQECEYSSKIPIVMLLYFYC